tara:strand:+ start:5565 stop:5696 length:132 start_codon:yes stop_codon:yes gene_type:complete
MIWVHEVYLPQIKEMYRLLVTDCPKIAEITGISLYDGKGMKYD